MSGLRHGALQAKRLGDFATLRIVLAAYHLQVPVETLWETLTNWILRGCSRFIALCLGIVLSAFCLLHLVIRSLLFRKLLSSTPTLYETSSRSPSCSNATSCETHSTGIIRNEIRATRQQLFKLLRNENLPDVKLHLRPFFSNNCPSCQAAPSWARRERT